MWDLAEGRRKLGCLFAPGATAAYPEIAGMPVPRPPVDLELMPGEPLACYNMAVVPGRRWRTPVRHIPPA